MVLFQCAGQHYSARLASIHSAQEQLFVNEIVSRQDTYGYNFWIGYFRSAIGEPDCLWKGNCALLMQFVP